MGSSWVRGTGGCFSWRNPYNVALQFVAPMGYLAPWMQEAVMLKYGNRYHLDTCWICIMSIIYKCTYQKGPHSSLYNIYYMFIQRQRTWNVMSGVTSSFVPLPRQTGAVPGLQRSRISSPSMGLQTLRSDFCTLAGSTQWGSQSQPGKAKHDGENGLFDIFERSIVYYLAKDETCLRDIYGYLRFIILRCRCCTVETFSKRSGFQSLQLSSFFLLPTLVCVQESRISNPM